jgi:hypothetical protein
LNDITNLVNDFLNMVEEKVQSGGAWREQPVDLLTFFKSDKFLKETPYEGKQTELLETLDKIVHWKLIQDEKYCPENLRNIVEAVPMLGKGSGKDFLISGFMAYMAYLLCCLYDPHKFFSFGQDEPIDLINVATNANQANAVFFKKLKARLRNCGWFKEVRHRQPETYNEFQVTRNQIRFYKNITCHSAHSEAEAYEGFNPLIIIFDEYGGYTPENAKNGYDILKTSASTRYGSRYLMVFISYPRSENCPMYTKYLEALKDTSGTMWAMIGKTWEVNKSVNKDTFKKQYEDDPETAQTLLECIPPTHYEGLFKFPERIDAVTVYGRYSQCPDLIVEEIITTRTLHSGEERHFIGLQLHNLNLNPEYTYFIGGDCGVTGDTYVITLYHGEPLLIETIENNSTVIKWINKPVEDLILEWRPNRKDRLPVDLVNVADTLELICQQVFVQKAMFDKFNSAEVTQRLMDYGVDAEDKAFSNPFQVQIYQNGKSVIYSGNIELLDYKPRDPNIASPNEELKAIKLVNGNKIDHDNKVGDKKVGKDYSDARMAAINLVVSTTPESIENFSMPSIMSAHRR